MTLKPKTLGWMTLVLGAAGCPSERPERARLGETKIQDSAGIRIVDNPGGDTALPEWTLEDRPVVEIVGDGADDEHDFQDVADARRLSTGEILLLVSRAGAYDFRVFDSTGKFLRKFGRKGQGPGELMSPEPLKGTRGDSIWIFDRAESRITLFTPDGKTPWMSSARGVDIWGKLPDGTWLARGPDLGPKFEAGRLSLTILRVNDTGATVSRFGPFPGDEGFLNQDNIVSWVRFGVGASWAIGDSLLYLGTQERWEIRGYQWDGTLRRIIRRDQPRRPVTAADRDRSKKRVLEGWKNMPPPPPPYVRELENARYADSFPAYAAIRADRDGNLWVQDPIVDPDAETLGWTVLDSQGRLEARARLPVERVAIITDLGEKYLLGIWPDSDNVRHVRLHRLVVRSATTSTK